MPFFRQPTIRFPRKQSLSLSLLLLSPRREAFSWERQEGGHTLFNLINASSARINVESLEICRKPNYKVNVRDLICKWSFRFIPKE